MNPQSHNHHVRLSDRASLIFQDRKTGDGIIQSLIESKGEPCEYNGLKITRVLDLPTNKTKTKMRNSQLPSDCGNYVDDDFEEDIADSKEGKRLHTSWVIITAIGLIWSVLAVIYLIYRVVFLA